MSDQFMPNNKIRVLLGEVKSSKWVPCSIHRGLPSLMHAVIGKAAVTVSDLLVLPGSSQVAFKFFQIIQVPLVGSD